jgi:hypothetical protein
VQGNRDALALVRVPTEGEERERFHYMFAPQSAWARVKFQRAVGISAWLDGWAEYLPLLCSPQTLPRVRRSINGNVSIILISITLCVRYGGALISAACR